MSYMGLESYLLQDNWSYQRSIACEYTPFYFQGARLQAHPTKKIKQEIWLLNGWQAYNSYSKSPGVGSSTYYRPSENIQYVANFYLGKDTHTPDSFGTQSDRIRFHHDNSIVARYYNKPNKKGISQMAMSINNHAGFQKGNNEKDTITYKQHFLVGTSISNRIWFNKNKFALTLRGDYTANGGGYLAFSPTNIINNDFNDAYVKNPNQVLRILQGTCTFDVMPNDAVTFRLEYCYRECNLPYFAGKGGTTSPNGLNSYSTSINSWRPDLLQVENRLTLCVNIRM
jgi:hypothetical protein